MGKRQKIFVLDTNVLLHDAECLKKFEDNEVILSITVIEELDKFKKGSEELNRNARHVLRELFSLMKKGKLCDGIKTEAGGIVRTELNCITPPNDAFASLSMKIADNRILLVAHNLNQQELKKEKGRKSVIFVSRDVNALVKASALGVEYDFHNSEKVNIDELYTGWKEKGVENEIIDEFYKNKSVACPEDMKGAPPNLFVLLKDVASNQHSCIARHSNGLLCKLENKPAWDLASKNIQQTMALELLMNPEIKIVTLVGQAGTGKTLLALAAGLEQVIKKSLYEKILVMRPLIPLGKELGTPPGDKEDKLKVWMSPIFDNLGLLLKGKVKELEEIGECDVVNENENVGKNEEVDEYEDVNVKNVDGKRDKKRKKSKKEKKIKKPRRITADDNINLLFKKK